MPIESNLSGGLLIASSGGTGETTIQTIPYYITFNKTLFNGTLAIKRETSGGSISITRIDTENNYYWTFISAPYRI